MTRKLKPLWNWNSALENATQVWKEDLKDMLVDAKSRFGDVVWRVVEDGSRNGYREVWGHKAMIYARAPPGFHLRHFSNKILVSSLENATSHSEEFGADGNTTTYTTPSRYTIFVQELLDIYTGKGGSGDFETLKCYYNNDQNWRTNQLREDLLSMWRTQLYSDVRIAISSKEPAPSNDHWAEDTIFRAHSFILISRSPYFHSVLHNTKRNSGSSGEDSVPDITLPSPLFDRTSLKCIMLYIYGGTLPLPFPDTTPYLHTVFDIWRGALFLGVKALPDLMAHQTTTMLHGLCFPDLDNVEYSRLTGGTWSGMVASGGCQCRTCQRRLPTVLKFTLSSATKDTTGNLRRGAVRGLIKSFGLCWCTHGFSSLPRNYKNHLLRQLQKLLMDPVNVIPILFAAEEALDKIDSLPLARQTHWIMSGKMMLVQARNSADRMLCEQTSKCFECSAWWDMVIDDAMGIHHGHQRKLLAIGNAIMRGVRSTGAIEVYKAINSFAGTQKKFYFNRPTRLETYLRCLREDVHRTMLLDVRRPDSPLGYTPGSSTHTSAIFQEISLSVTDTQQSSIRSSSLSFVSGVVLDPERQASASDSSVDALELASVTNYSHASSRTESTDYGFFYTRRAYSQDSFGTVGR